MLEKQKQPREISKSAAMLAVLALVTLLMLSVRSELTEDEWKSLSNPQTRTLFFRILQTYLEGRESEARAMGQKTSMKENRNQNQNNPGYDMYSLLLHNDISNV